MKSNGIGALQENDLHRDLIRFYAIPGDQFEVDLDGYVIDILRGNEIIEIQTSNFSSIRKKLTDLLVTHPVRLVYPIPKQAWIIRHDLGGNVLSRRKSPKRGTYHEIFSQLVAFPALVSHPNFSLELLLIHSEVWRVHDPNGPWRRNGWRVFNRRLLEVLSALRIDTPRDVLELLPKGLPDPFTTSELARQAGINRRLAQKMAYCLRESNLLQIQGRNRQGYTYTQRL